MTASEQAPATDSRSDLITRDPHAAEEATGNVVEQERRGPRLKFVRWDHAKQNNSELVKQLEDCDVVGIEYLGFKDKAERQEFNYLATVYVSADPDKEEWLKAEAVMKTQAPLSQDLFERLRGSNKRVVTLDINNDNPAHDFHIGWRESKNKVKLINKENRSNRELKKAILEEKRELARFSAAREPQLIEEITELTESYADEDVKIGVVVGAAHTPVYHEIAKRFPVEQTSVSQRVRENDKDQRFYFSPLERLTHFLQFHPEAPVPEGLLNRAALHSMYAASVLEADRTRLLDKMPDTEVAATLLALDGLKLAVVNRLFKSRTRRRVGKLIVEKFNEVDARQKKNESS